MVLENLQTVFIEVPKGFRVWLSLRVPLTSYEGKL